jgi:phosphohistidine phosphatase
VRRLILLRHAKSDWGDPDRADHDRPLNARGKRDAPAVGGWLDRSGHVPDLVLCSPAKRARSTLRRLGLPASVPVTVDPALYGAEADELLDRVRLVDDAVGTVLLVAHNPGMHDLLTDLVDPADRPRVTEFPTAACAVVDLDVDRWAGTRPEGGRLSAYVTPRTLPG